MAQKYYESSRGDIAYDKRGLGDPALLVHGIYPGASHHEFRRNIDALARQFTVYAIDLLGFGDSDMPRITYTAQIYQHLLRDFIVEVIGQPTHVIASGVSCGPVVALAVYNDELLGRLVLIDPPVGNSQVEHPPTVANKVQQFLLGTLSMGVGLYEAVSSEFELKRFLLTRYAQPRHVTGEQVADLHERASRRHAMHAIVSNMTGHLALDLPRWIRFVRRHTLIVWGEQSGPAPAERLLRPAAWSRGKRIEVIPKTAHWPHDEQSAKVNTLLVEFLGEEVTKT